MVVLLNKSHLPLMDRLISSHRRDQCPGTPITRMFEQIPQGQRTDFLLQTLSASLPTKPRLYVQYPTWWGDGHVEETVAPARVVDVEEKSVCMGNDGGRGVRSESCTQTEQAREDPIFSLHDTPSPARKRDFFSVPVDRPPPIKQSNVQNAVRINSAKKKMIQKSHDVSEPVQYARTAVRSVLGRELHGTPVAKERINSGRTPVKMKARVKEEVKLYDEYGEEKFSSEVNIMEVVKNFLSSNLLTCLDLSVLDDGKLEPES